MTQPQHPRDALFTDEKPIAAIPVCEHYAGSEKLIAKALELQQKTGPIFDITFDCEDGAPTGREQAHAEMVVAMLNSPANAHGRAGARIHDPRHPHWRRDVDIILGGAAQRVAYITVPKSQSAREAGEVIDHIRKVAKRPVPVHLLVETHGALHDAWALAALPNVESLAFGLLDFVSAHHGAIPSANMRSPGQFEHPLLARAKTEIVAAALAHGVVPAHNVSTDIKNPYNVFRDAWRARHDFGFLRMWSIHPAQVQPIVDAMKPELPEVADAAGILLSAREKDWGPIQYAGELHDRASYRYYWQVLQKAKLTGVGIPEDALEAFF